MTQYQKRNANDVAITDSNCSIMYNLHSIVFTSCFHPTVSKYTVRTSNLLEPLLALEYKVVGSVVHKSHGSSLLAANLIH